MTSEIPAFPDPRAGDNLRAEDPDPSKLLAAPAASADRAVDEAGAAGSGVSEKSPGSHHEALDRIGEMPKDVGWLLLISGLLSELGMVGVPPFWIFGILILWPDLGRPLGNCLHRRAPKAFHGSVGMINRFVSDLERRYPRR
jgi:hypothetical protein